MRRFFLLLIITVIAFAVHAQQPDTLKKQTRKDSVYRKADSATSKPFVPRVTRVIKEKKYYPDSLHDPHKAVIRSLTIPGLGQIYNHDWWKLPIIYGGLGATGYYIIWNNSQYQDYLALAKYQQKGINYDDKIYDNDKRKKFYKENGKYPAQAVLDAKDYYRRNRDLCILGFIIGWGVQAIDAYVWAKFKHSYSMDNDLGIHFSGGLTPQPIYASNFNSNFTPTLKVTFTLK